MTAERVRLGNAADLLVGFAFKSAQFLQPDEPGINLVRGDNVQHGYLRWGDKAMKWNSDAFDDLTRYQLQLDDVVLAMDRPIVGGGLKLAWVKESDLPCLLVQRVTRIRGLPEVADTTYLRYALSAPDFVAHIDRVTTGANIPHISGKDIAAFELRLPTLDQQLEVVERLTAYDDLIENNRRRIALLEESARLLYREWFVHLRFPGHEAVPVKDGVPEGWQRLPFSNVADFINGFAFKPENLHDTGLPVVKIPELRDGISPKTPYNDGSSVPLRNHIDTGDVLFSWSATLLVSEWGEGPALLNQHLFKVVPKRVIDKRLVRFAVEAEIPKLLGHSVGATMQHIRRSALDDHTMLQPTIKIASDFAVRVDPMMDSVLNLKAQLRMLIEARDALLPKLMSGEIAV